MNNRDTQNLLFLLMAAPIGMGGCVITTDDDGDTDANASTGQATTDDPTGQATTDDPTGQATTDDPTGQATTDATTTGEDTTAGNDTTAGGESSSGGDDGICTEYAAVVTECYDEKAGAAAADYCPEYLQGLYDDYGQACVDAYEDYLACLSGLTCKEFMGEDACAKELAATEKPCSGKK